MDLSLNTNSCRELLITDGDDVDDKKKEPEQLFEESWFFGNLLRTSKSNKPKAIMYRSLSDSTTTRTPSSPSVPSASKGSHLSIRRKMPSSSSSRSLDSEDEEIEFSMGELIKQAASMRSPGNSSSPKKLTRTSYSSISRQRSLQEYEPKISNTEEEEEGSSGDDVIIMPMKQLQQQKISLTSTLESRELQGFRDLGFELDNPNYAENSIISTPNINRNSYYMHRSLASNGLTMKEQIRFWARAVAYTVRQEC